MHKAERLLEALQKVRPKIALGLQSSLSALDMIGNPHHKLKVVHVAGTNGKGSICAMIASVYRKAGYKVGTYNSPHLLRWSESISTLDWQSALIHPEKSVQSIDDWHKCVLDVAEKSERIGLTAFEMATAAMWLHFVRSDVDIVIVEAGVGGRQDATNVCPSCEASIISSVDMDHQVKKKFFN